MASKPPTSFTAHATTYACWTSNVCCWSIALLTNAFLIKKAITIVRKAPPTNKRNSVLFGAAPDGRDQNKVNTYHITMLINSANQSVRMVRSRNSITLVCAVDEHRDVVR